MNHTPDGGITFVVPLYHDTHARALLRGDVNRSDLSISYSTALSFTEDIVETITDDDEDELDDKWFLLEMIPHADRSMTVIFGRRSESMSYSTMRESYDSKVEYGPTIIARVGTDGTVLSSAYLDDKTKYPMENYGQLYETIVTHRHTAGNLVLGFRTREEDGFVVYTMPLGAASGEISRQNILTLDDSDHYTVSRDAIWFGDRDLFLPVQMGANDDEFSLVRVRW